MTAIGVFDSGVGGLTVMAALQRRLPEESLLYLGDTARLPYGMKSEETVTRYAARNLDFLVRRGVKAVVVACNTASALALDKIEVPVPVWGVVEPGAQQAAAASGGRVGVLATESTVRSGAYPRALRRLRPELEILSQACPLFVPLVEEGWHDDPIALQVTERYLRPILDQGVDTLVLGCTHYPLLEPTIRQVAGDKVILVDSAEAVADEVAAALESEGLAHHPESGSRAEPEYHLCVTDAGEHFSRISHRILGESSASLELVELV